MSLTGLAMILALSIAAGALSWGAVVDIRRYMIPNVVCAAVALSFLPMAIFMPPMFLIGGLLTGLAVLVVGVFVFARGWMGGGDVKLLAATSLWAGPTLFLPFAIVTSLGAGLLAMLILSPFSRYLPAHPAAATAGPVPIGRQPMPFGVAIAMGGLWLIVHHFASIR